MPAELYCFLDQESLSILVIAGSSIEVYIWRTFDTRLTPTVDFPEPLEIYEDQGLRGICIFIETLFILIFTYPFILLLFVKLHLYTSKGIAEERNECP
ncbi:hypothetical protein CEXT_78141 [Caerostris extrusa]|uniref:Uncharacterized protein n=1 Tax=Caerostris extrusa TaxID=172846 RepID=A0AAV4S2K0_CAEEX|nr:hypothetical protein CEXT_78141 [Caerostris extrusa]